MAKHSRWGRVTREVVLEFFDYEPQTGLLIWRERDRQWFPCDRSWRTWNTKNAGKRAGAVRTNRYGYSKREVSVFGRTYGEHQIIWLYATEEPLPPEIDHKNRDATDNRWINLRSSTRQKNSCNQSRRTDNTSGLAGVTWNKQTSKWLAQCWFDRKPHYLGRFASLDEAKNAVLAFRVSVGFEPGHGVAARSEKRL